MASYYSDNFILGKQNEKTVSCDQNVAIGYKAMTASTHVILPPTDEDYNVNENNMDLTDSHVNWEDWEDGFREKMEDVLKGRTCKVNVPPPIPKQKTQEHQLMERGARQYFSSNEKIRDLEIINADLLKEKHALQLENAELRQKFESNSKVVNQAAEVVTKVKNELDDLQKEVIDLRIENQRLKQENRKLKSTNSVIEQSKKKANSFVKAIVDWFNK